MTDALQLRVNGQGQLRQLHLPAWQAPNLALDKLYCCLHISYIYLQQRISCSSHLFLCQLPVKARFRCKAAGHP